METVLAFFLKKIQFWRKHHRFLKQRQLNKGHKGGLISVNLSLPERYPAVFDEWCDPSSANLSLSNGGQKIDFESQLFRDSLLSHRAI
jgi:hypothetical protein